jgi:hypothetical protein
VFDALSVMVCFVAFSATAATKCIHGPMNETKKSLYVQNLSSTLIVTANE